MIDDLQRLAAIDLCSAPPSGETLLRLITWLDLHSQGGEMDSLPRLMLARAVAAEGLTLPEGLTQENIQRTIHAAVRFAHAPSEENRAQLFEAATASYPFGPGEGCYAVAETGYPDCEPGSGCRSGAGCLWMGELEAAAIMAAISRGLLPWLKGEEDPLAGS